MKRRALMEDISEGEIDRYDCYLLQVLVPIEFVSCLNYPLKGFQLPKILSSKL